MFAGVDIQILLAVLYVKPWMSQAVMCCDGLILSPRTEYVGIEQLGDLIGRFSLYKLSIDSLSVPNLPMGHTR